MILKMILWMTLWMILSIAANQRHTLIVPVSGKLQSKSSPRQSEGELCVQIVLKTIWRPT